MNNTESAVDMYEEGFSCTQAVLAAYCEKFGLDKDAALKISSGFGGGMHLDQTCGAVTGAFMVIGLKYGRYKVDDLEAKKKTYLVMAYLAEKFKTKHKSISCTKLMGCDISTIDGLEKAKEKDLFNKLCPVYVRTAAQILEEIL